MTVLITGASYAEAFKLARLIGSEDIVFADHHDLPRFAFSGKKTIRLPKGDSASYAHLLLTTCLDLGITTVYPLYEDEIMPLAQSARLFEEYGIRLMLPSADWLKANHKTEARQTANLLVADQGKIIAGAPAGEVNLPEEVSGVFTLTEENNTLTFKLFTISDVELR